MDTEFHYYWTGLIAHAAGFEVEESKIIAKSSEYVDENDTKIFVKNRSTNEKYESYISQTMNILKPKKVLMRIYPVFHFIPGDPSAETAYRTDGKMHILNTTPNNEIANILFDEAFKSTEDMRLYRIGIAAHAFADTWAHQNFVGWYDFFNNIGMDPKPDIGHADAEHHPDMVAHRWEDSRLKEQEICNNKRFFDAAKCLYDKFSYFNTCILKRKVNTSWENLLKFFLNLTDNTCSGSFNYNKKSRRIMYEGEAVWLGEYDEREWLQEAVVTKVHGLPDEKPGALFTLFDDESFWKDGIDVETTHWFRFQESIKAHQKFAMSLLQPKFETMGINLRHF